MIMMLLRFVVIAGVLVATGVYAPARAAAMPVAFTPTLAEKDKKGGGDVPRPRPTPGPKDSNTKLLSFNSNLFEQKKKADPPPRPKPKAGPKDGGEDE